MSHCGRFQPRAISRRDMLRRGATTTMEAWAPEDKANMDWAHPWCASPSFTIPGSVLGVRPTAPGWAAWRFWPQPSALADAAARVPTPAGDIAATWAARGGGQGWGQGRA